MEAAPDAAMALDHGDSAVGSRRRRHPESGGPRLRGRVVVGAAALLLAATAIWGDVRRARASSGEGLLEPKGRGLQLLGAREAILLEQSERARRAARSRALGLYRLLRVTSLERRAVPGETTKTTKSDDNLRTGAEGGGRSVALATAVLARDLSEARSLRAELDRVRAERAAIGVLPDARAGADIAAQAARSELEGTGASAAPASLPSFLRPVTGPLLLPFGVGRDPASGAWIFRAAATFAAKSAEPVRSPADAVVARVATSVAGGAAVVLSSTARGESGGRATPVWTLVLSGLASVAVGPGETVRRGDALGRAAARPGGQGSPQTAAGVGSGGDFPDAIRIETWRGRDPVDPAAVLRVR